MDVISQYFATPHFRRSLHLGPLTAVGLLLVLFVGTPAFAQAGDPFPSCSYTLSASSSGVLPANATSGAVTVTTTGGCAWTATASQSWIHTSSSGSGSGTVSFSVDANPGAPRSGTIVIAGQSYSVTQAAGLQGGAVISLDPATTYQTMRGWEATATAFRFTTDAFLQQVVDAGINRVRLEIKAGAENSIDYYGAWQATLGGVETSDPIPGSSPQADAFIANMYRTVNDNSNPNAVNAAGFHFTQQDNAIQRTVNPMRAKLAARGERLYVNLCYVAFNPNGAVPVHQDAAEYAELMLATFQYLQNTYGWVPDGIELMLEPDNRPTWWNGTSMAQRLLATQAKLAAAGFHPDFIGPSTTDTHNAWFFIDDMLKVPGVTSYLKELSYHRYAESDPMYVAGVGARAAALGIGGSMLEWWTTANTYATLHEDLTLGRSSAYQRGVVQPLNNADFYTYHRHYFSHVRMGAQRIGATTTDTTFDPVAFINTNGTYAVVVKAGAAGPINVPGLPAGTYGIRYTTGSAIDVDAGSQTVGPGGTVSTSIPDAGVLVVFGGPANNPTPPPGAPGSLFKSNPAAGSALGQSTTATLTWTASNGATGYEYCVDTVDDDNCLTPWTSAGAATSATLTGLNGGTNYYWQVRATNGAGITYANGHSSVFWRFTTAAGLAAPGSFGKGNPVNGATNQPTTVALGWGASSGATGYEYCLDGNLNGVCDTAWVSTGSAQAATVSGLTPGTAYSWQVRAVNSGGTSPADAAAFWSFTTAPAVCTYALGSPGVGPLPAGGGEGSVTMTTGSSCTWTVLADRPWIHTASGGAGNGIVAYLIDANPGPSRNGTITAGGQTFQVSQAAAACSYVLGAGSSGTLASTASGGAVSITTGSWCAWTSVADQGWIHTASAGSGTGTVTFTVDANPGATRNGVITVAGQSFLIAQAAAACSYALGATSSGTLGAAAGGGAVTVTTGSACPWTAMPDQSWIHTTSAGLGTGTITYTVDANAGLSRSGTITIGAQTFAVTQSGGPGAFLKSSPATDGTSGQSTSATLVWTTSNGATTYEYCLDATDDDACSTTWVDVGNATSTTVSGLTGGTRYYWQIRAINAGAVTYADGSTIGFRSFTTSPGATAPGTFAKAAPASGATNQQTSVALSWAASSDATSYEYCVDTNLNTVCDTAWVSTGTARTVIVSGLAAATAYSWQVRAQGAGGTTTADSGVFWSFSTAAPPCTFALGSSGSGLLPAAAGGGTVTVATGSSCAWTAAADQSWIHTASAGSGNGTVAFTVDANPGPNRSGAITIAGSTFQIDQAGLPAHKAELTTPAGGSTLTGSTATFTWTGGVGVAKYALRIGTAFGVFDLLDQEVGTSLSAVATSLPTNGSTLYVRLDSEIFGVWQSNHYTLTAATVVVPRKAELITPAPSSTLTASTATFEWTGGTGVARYWLYVGLSAGSFDLANLDMGTGLTGVVAHLPIDGRTLYVRLFSHIDGAWLYNDYTMQAVTAATSQRAELVSPAPGSTLTSSTVTFVWTGGTEATRYWLDIGTAMDAYDLWSGDLGTSLSAVVSGLPTDGRTLYIRLHSNIYGFWEHNSYTLTALALTTSPKAELVSPAPDSTLAGSSVSFSWTGGTGVSRYWLNVGDAPGTFNLFNSDMGTALNAVVTGLPTDGRAVYVRLYSLIDGGWQYNDYKLTAAASAAPSKAELVTPAPGSTLTSGTVTFEWTGGTGVARYWLNVGTLPGGFDLLSRDAGTNLNTVVNGLPTDARTLYVRLYSHISGNWEYNDYQLTAAGIVTRQKAELISPAPGSTLTSSTVTFEWTGGAGVTHYYLNVGSWAGAFDLASRDAGTSLSAVVTSLPTDGRVIYVRLFSLIDGGWSYIDYVLTAAGGQ